MDFDIDSNGMRVLNVCVCMCVGVVSQTVPQGYYNYDVVHPVVNIISCNFKLITLLHVNSLHTHIYTPILVLHDHMHTLNVHVDQDC